ncbi:MAG: tetratricopeptide repeat protein [Thermodesulfobacteriota bacterium]|nr:tetratricopeptide repeat protein [Thermodesulfobacteriota bacterium]
MEHKRNNIVNPWAALILIMVIAVVSYSNSFYCSWHFDDVDSILTAENVHVTVFQFSAFKKALLKPHSDSGKIHRPVSRLTFAINWFLGGANVTGYHVLNIAIHFLSAFFLFLIIFQILQSPCLKGEYNNESAYFIALLASVLWVVNPVQTQAVTYIVQRMTSLAATFYVVGILTYIKARQASSARRKAMLFIACLLSFLLGVGSKENAVILPASLILIEWLFWGERWRKWSGKQLLVTIGAIIALIGVLSYSLFLGGELSAVFHNYENYDFSAWQRLMTEARVLIFYLSQLFYPVPTRLSLTHDFAISTSIFHPWTTLPAIGIIVFLISLAIAVRKNHPLVSLAILFYFINHVVESTIYPLDLVFEHRNYLPSVFLFLPVAAGLKRLIDYYNNQKSGLYWILIGFIILLITGLGAGTYIRNMAWMTEESLWRDVIQKTPGHSRAYSNLAFQYNRRGQLDKALSLYQKAADLKAVNDSDKAEVLFNIAEVYRKKEQWTQAGSYYEAALALASAHKEIRYRYAKALTTHGELGEAQAVLAPLIQEYPDNNMFCTLQGRILLKLNDPEGAFDYFLKALTGPAALRHVSKDIAIAFYLSDNYERATLYFKEFLSDYPLDMQGLLWLVATSLKADDQSQAEHYTVMVLHRETGHKLKKALARLKTLGFMPATDREILCRWFDRQMQIKTDAAAARIKDGKCLTE